MTTQYVQSLNKFFGQPDDVLHTGPKHVVVQYITLYIATNCNIVVFMTVRIYIYIYIYIHTHTHYNFVLFPSKSNRFLSVLKCAGVKVSSS